MKKRLKSILTFIASFFMAASIACGAITVNAYENNEQVSAVTLDDIVVSNGGEIAFQKIDPMYDKYNINRGSDTIDTEGTIDEVLVLSTESSETVFTFKTHLNRDYLTKYFNIIEWFIVPSNLQSYEEYGIAGFADSDFETFEITVKDVQSPDKYVTFTTSNRPDSATYRNVVSGRVGANGQSVNGLLGTEIDRSWGCTLKASHVGCFEANDGVPTGFDQKLPLGAFLSIDYETKKVYSVTGANKGERKLVRDLDDGTHMIGTDIPWEGFTSNELEVSIRFLNIVSGRKASVAILNYNGADFTKGEIVDEKAPTVIETTEFSGELFGVTNRAMPIMDYVAYYALDGFINQTESRVYYNYNKASQKEYVVTNGKFTPDKTGIYHIVTTATDRFGNVGKFVREVEIRNVIPDIELSFAEPIPANCKVGDAIELPIPQIYGGTVNKSYRVDVLLAGKEIAVNGNVLHVEKQGVYTIRYAVWDYYGEETYFDYYLNAKLGDKPIAEFPELPKNAIVGSRVIIPDFKAIDYLTFSDAVNAVVKYEVKGPSDTQYSTLNENYFVPQSEGTYLLKIIVSQVGNSNNKVEQEYAIECKKCYRVSDYFITENIELVEVYKNFAFKTVGSQSKISFINAISNQNLAFTFNVYDISDKSKISIRLSDSAVTANYIDLSITAENTRESLLTINGQSYVINGAPFDSTGMSQQDMKPLKAATLYNLSYQNGWIFNGNVAVCRLDNYSNGKTFDGFTSGRAYFEMVVDSAKGDTTVELANFCGNQDFSLKATDITEPTITLSSVGRIVKMGDLVSFTYSVDDLFDLDCALEVTVKYKGETVASGKDGACSFTITKFGEYVVRLLATDKAGNETLLDFNVYCFDNIAPQINVLKKVASKVKVGQILTLPKATVSDNMNTDLGYYIFAKTPTNSYRLISEHTFKPDSKGVWTIYYYAEDAYGNYDVQVFYVNVV